MVCLQTSRKTGLSKQHKMLSVTFGNDRIDHIILFSSGGCGAVLENTVLALHLLNPQLLVRRLPKIFV